MLMRITFLGADHEVTGRLPLSTGGRQEHFN